MLDDPGIGLGDGGYAFYLGRLSSEKGIDTLLDAWLKHEPGIRLVICGNGPLAPKVEHAAARSDRIAWYANRSDDEVLRRLGEASLFILPSINFEGFPKTIVEAYAKGTPVVASRLGAMAELVHEGISGACFKAGDAADLARTVARTICDAARLARMRLATRRLFETQYSASSSYDRLLEIYGHALRTRHVGTARVNQTPSASASEIGKYANSPDSYHADNRDEVCTV